MRFKLNNKTAWNSKQLKRIVNECLNRQVEHSDRNYRIDIVYARQNLGCSGYAYYHRPYCRIRVPGPRIRRFDESLLKDFIGVVLHEIDHTLGHSHKDMGRHSPYALSMFDTAITEIIEKLGAGFVVEAKQVKVVVKAPVDRAAKALERAKTRLAKAEREQASAEKRIQKWRREVTRLDGYIRRRGELVLAAA